MLAAGTMALPPSAAHGGWDAYTAVAEADGLQVSVHVPGGPLNDDVLDAGSPRAQAQLDSLGTSVAFAAAPWPGELLANSTGLLSGIIGRPLPSYPLIARSSHPTKDQDHQSAGPVTLTARSAAAAASSRGTDSSSATDSTADVSRSEAGDLSAKASSVLQGLVVGPLELGRVEARAAATRRTDGSLQRTSAATVAAVRVAGQAVELTERGLVLAGTTVPLSPADPALRELADAGVVVRWVAEQELPDGVVSPGVEITLTAPVSLAGGGSSFVRWTVGRSSARVAVSGRPQTQSELPPEPAPVAPNPAPPPSGEQGGVTPVDGPVPAGAAAPAPGPVAAPAALGVDVRAGRRSIEVWPTFYLPLVAAGLLALGSAAALRRWGVRRVWAP